MRTVKPDREARFRALFDDAYDDVLRFALRRVHPSQAEDVVADAFLVAWRRFDDAPGSLDDRRALRRQLDHPGSPSYARLETPLEAQS
jgi:RNA polymerase sigma-70 factor (ECF subfamily)